MAERLIDAELLKHTTERLINEEEANGFYPKSWDEEVIAFKYLIDSMPTIEAKPVVHAHWEIEYDDDDNIKKCYCSNCGVGCEPMNYCGFCGAQMDEGVKIPVISMEDIPKIMEENK